MNKKNILKVCYFLIYIVICMFVYNVESKYSKYCWELNVKIHVWYRKGGFFNLHGKKSSQWNYSLSFFIFLQVEDVFFYNRLWICSNPLNMNILCLWNIHTPNGAKSKITTFLTRLYEFGTLQKSPVSSLVAFTQRDQAIFNGLLKQKFAFPFGHMTWKSERIVLPLDDTPIRSLVAIK